MAKTKYSLYDNEQLGFFKADERTSSAFGYIKNQSGKLEIKAEATNSILLKSDLELTSGASIKSSSGIINIGASGDTINLNIGGVIYNVGSMTGSPIISGNITVNGSGTNSFYGTSNFYGTVNLFGATMNIEATTISVDDKNIELGAVTTPTDTTANGGGIILKGATDKTILWADSTDTWNFNQGIISTGNINAVGRSTSWGSSNGVNTGAFNTIMGTTSSATWLLSGTSGGTFRAGIQALDSNGVLRFYVGSNYANFDGITFSANTFSGALSGNATTATTLQTARLINGVSFNGSADIVVPTTYDAGFTRITNPGGGVYTTGSPTVTGAIAVTLPVSYTNTMLRITIKIYEYVTNESFEVHCGGYNYASTWTNNPFAYIIGNPSIDRRFTVRFGHNGTKSVIYIGETNSTWSYPQVFVTDVQLGFNGLSLSYTTGWSVGFATSFQNVTATISDCQVGFASTGNTTGALVKRGASGEFTAGSITTTSQFLGNASDTISAPSFSWSGDENTGIYHPAADTLAITTGGVERLRVSSTGNVGIGMTNPTYKLDVSGSINGTDYYLNGVYQKGYIYPYYKTLTRAANSIEEWYKIIDLSGNVVSTKLRIYVSGDNTECDDEFIIVTAGYNFIHRITQMSTSYYNGGKLLEVKTNNPSGSAPTEIWIRLASLTNSGYLRVFSTSPLNDLIPSSPSFSGNGIASMIFDSTTRSTYSFNTNRGISVGTSGAASYFGGNVGIGTSTPGAKLDVYYGATRLWHSTEAYTQFNANELNHYSSTGGASTLYIQYPSGNWNTNIGRGALVVKGNGGNVGIGTASPSYKLDVSGSTNTTSLYVSGTQLKRKKQILSVTTAIVAGETVTIPNSESYVMGSDQLLVFVDGMLQYLIEDYTEYSTTQIKFTYDIPAGAKILFYII